VESQELLIDGATALAGGAGVVYWGLSRFFYMPEGPLSYESGRYVKENFDFARDHQDVFAAADAQPLAGVMVGDQTIDWFAGKHYVSKGYENYYHGAWQVMKDLGYDSEPFLDYLMTPAQLGRYKLVYLPNAACLSDGQCAMLRDYVTAGGALIATHLTSVADEHGRMRPNFGLADLFGAKFAYIEPVEIPDLYLKLPSGELIPQDPQVLRFTNTGDGAVRRFCVSPIPAMAPCSPRPSTSAIAAISARRSSNAQPAKALSSTSVPASRPSMPRRA
jgi:hypothetical protein